MVTAAHPAAQGATPEFEPASTTPREVLGTTGGDQSVMLAMGVRGESIRTKSRYVDRAVEEEEEVHVLSHRLGHVEGSVPSQHVPGPPEVCKGLEDLCAARLLGAAVAEEWPVPRLLPWHMVEEGVVDVNEGPAPLG